MLTVAAALREQASTGRLTTLGPVDYEFLPSYTLQLRVTDLRGLADFLNVTVNVINANEAPVMRPGQVRRTRAACRGRLGWLASRVRLGLVRPADVHRGGGLGHYQQLWACYC